MKNILLAGLGGFFGSALRYKISFVIAENFKNTKLPLSILSVNLIGCFFAGVTIALLGKLNITDKNISILIITGFMGGFTTFSAFSAETIDLIHHGHKIEAIMYILFTTILCILFMWAGQKIINLWG